MTATLPPPAAATETPRAPGGRPAPEPSRRRASRARHVLLRTPGKLWALGTALVLLSIAWGGLGALIATQHSAAADSVASGNERLTLESRHLYQSIADADATITAAYLASPTPGLPQLQRYEVDLSTAHGDLSVLQAAAGNSPAVGPALASLSNSLALYAEYIGEAKTEYAMGFPLTGGSFLSVASEQAHLALLPAANAVFTRENADLDAANGRATGLPTMIGLLALAVAAGAFFVWAQRWLTRRTNRMFSPGLVIASLALLGSALWVLVAFAGGRSDLDGGISHGSGPAQNLALASIGVQQIRGDSVLNVISRSGSTSFADDFTAASKEVDGWLGAAGTAQDNAGDAALVAATQRDATAWYGVNRQVYAAGHSANYAEERNLVIGTGTGTTATGYSLLEADFSRAINADQAVFASAAASGASELDPLAGLLAASAAVMVLGCGWAISRRLAEYR
jgi:hypothetical protein